jgi:hypothetical protein
MKKNASAILLSFFLMSMLIVVGIGLTAIVLGDLTSLRTMVNGYKARYAAEGMAELGLKIIKDKLPGYETEILGQTFASEASADLTILAREKAVPCEDQDDDDWRSLGFNESIQIPLFYQDETEVKNLSEFIVNFYMPENLNPHGDIFRWKILGLNSSNETESISEYIGIDGSKNSEANPSVFGASPDTSLPQDFYSANYYRPNGRGGFIFEEVYSINSFLNEHDYNYLVLTNIVQLAAQGTLNDEEDQNEINFKYESDPAVCEYVDLNTSSDYANVIQSINTLIKEGENLPVFDFALYHTKGKL